MRIEASRLWLLGAALLQLGGRVVAQSTTPPLRVDIEVMTSEPGLYLKSVPPGTEAVYTVSSTQKITVERLVLLQDGMSEEKYLASYTPSFGHEENLYVSPPDIEPSKPANIIITSRMVDEIEWRQRGVQPLRLSFLLRHNASEQPTKSHFFGITRAERLDPSFQQWAKNFTDNSNSVTSTSSTATVTSTYDLTVGASLNPTATTPLGPGMPSDSGLSTGAIAGIAVAASLLALVSFGAIAWFLLRRRRRNRAGAVGADGGYGGGRSGDIIPEKEAAASGAAVDSPHSPYSDDGLQRDDAAFVGPSHHPLSQAVGPDVAAGVGAAAIAGGAGVAGFTPAPHHHEQQQHQQAAYMRYSDHPPQPSTSSANASPTSTVMPQSAAAVPRAASIDEEQTHGVAAMQAPRTGTGMSGRYAHLVEDHMTPEDIARIEAEERELDAAIEQARGTTRL